MNKALLFKIILLLAGLLGVISLSQFISSSQFKQNLNGVFFPNVQSYQWCDPRYENMRWSSAASEVIAQINLKTKEERQKFCIVSFEGIQGVDLKSAQWSDLLEGAKPEGQKVILRWDAALKVYLVDGLPFQSASLNQALGI